MQNDVILQCQIQILSILVVNGGKQKDITPKLEKFVLCVKKKQNDRSVALHKMKCSQSGSNTKEGIHKFENELCGELASMDTSTTTEDGNFHDRCSQLI